MIDLSLLMTQGFLVVPDFLNSKEVKALKWGYDQLRSKNNTNLGSEHIYNEDFGKMFAVPVAVASLIYSKIKQMSEQITANTDIKLNFDNNQCNGFYADLNFINGNNGNDSTLVWHQDQGAWTLHQQSYDYVNFYIMINKENPNTTNLSVIPQDILTDRIPNQIHKIVRQGAQRFFPKDKETLVKDDNTDEEYTLPFNIEEISKSPNLLPGDVLILRGDVIHKSQDNIAPRTAASFRIFANAILNKQKLLAGGREKQNYLKNNHTRIKPILQAFEYYGRDDITYTEYFNYANNLL